MSLPLGVLLSGFNGFMCSPINTTIIFIFCTLQIDATDLTKQSGVGHSGSTAVIAINNSPCGDQTMAVPLNRNRRI